MLRFQSLGDLREERREETPLRKPLANSTNVAAPEAAQNLTSGELLQWERELLRREREMLARERETLWETQRTSTLNVESRAFMKDAAELIPVFDPADNTTLSSDVWIRKVENVARLYGWDDRTTLLQAIPKLKSAAKHWLNGKEINIDSWGEFKMEFTRGFPSVMDEVDIHNELSRRTKLPDEGYDNYVYEMAAISAKASLSETAVIKYAIAGIPDREVRKMLTLCRFETIQELLRQVKAYEAAFEVQHTSRTNEARSVRADEPRKEAQARPMATTNDRRETVKCYNCNSEGHLARHCRQPRQDVQCYSCGETGHIAQNCPKREENTRHVRRVTVEGPRDEYYKLVRLQNAELWAFIDLGSDCVTIRKSAADRIGVSTSGNRRPLTLKGFGRGLCRSLGSRLLRMSIDEVEIAAEVVIVPDEVQEEELIVGRSALDQKDIRLIKEWGKLTIERTRATVRRVWEKESRQKIPEEDEDGEMDRGVYKQRYERALEELEFTRRRHQQQHEDDLEPLVKLKKQLEKKLSNAYEEVEEQRKFVGQWKRKVQKLSGEANDLLLLLEEQNARNNLLEKKQRKFDAEMQLLQDELRQGKQTKEHLTREKELVMAEKYTVDSNLAVQNDNDEDRDVPMAELRVLAQDRTRKHRANQKRRFDEARRTPTRYTVGDLVLIEREPYATETSRKLAPKYRGPYQVKKELGNDCYVLVDVKGAERTQRPFEQIYASDRMKKLQAEDSSDEKGESDSDEKGGSDSGEKGGSDSDEKEGSDSGEKEGSDSGEKGGSDSGEKGGSDRDENGGSDSDEKGGSDSDEKGGRDSDEKEGSDSDEKGGSGSDEKEGSDSDEMGGSDSDEKGGSDSDTTEEEDELVTVEDPEPAEDGRKSQEWSSCNARWRGGPTATKGRGTDDRREAEEGK